MNFNKNDNNNNLYRDIFKKRYFEIITIDPFCTMVRVKKNQLKKGLNNNDN